MSTMQSDRPRIDGNLAADVSDDAIGVDIQFPSDGPPDEQPNITNNTARRISDRATGVKIGPTPQARAEQPPRWKRLAMWLVKTIAGRLVGGAVSIGFFWALAHSQGYF